MSEIETIRALAQRLFDGIEKGDVGVLREVYAPGIAVWHNTDLATQGLEENLKTLERFVRHIVERRYEDRRLDVYSGGFVQQHKLSGVRPDGKRVSLHACIVCKVANERIARLDEYFDSAALKDFF